MRSFKIQQAKVLIIRTDKTPKKLPFQPMEANHWSNSLLLELRYQNKIEAIPFSTIKEVNLASPNHQLKRQNLVKFHNSCLKKSQNISIVLLQAVLLKMKNLFSISL